MKSPNSKIQISNKIQNPKSKKRFDILAWDLICYLSFGLWISVAFPFKRILAVIFLVMLFIVPISSSAQGGLVPCGGPGQNPCSICDFGILIINITNFFIYKIAIPLAGLMILIGGLMIMLGAASEQRVTAGKKILTNAIIGVVIVFTAWLMVDTVIKILTGSYGQRSFFGTLGPWNRIPPGACPFGGGISPTAPVENPADGTSPKEPFPAELPPVAPF